MKSKIVLIVIVLAISAGIAGCAQKTQVNLKNTANTVTTKNTSAVNATNTTSISFNSTKNLVKYAKYFKLYKYNNGDYLLEVKDLNGWNKYVLYRNNTTKPKVENAEYIRIPVHRLVVMSSTHIAMLEAINSTNCLVGYMYGNRYKLYFPDVVKKLKSGEIVDVGTPENPDYEKIVKLHPDLVVIYAYVMGVNSVPKKLKELHIPYVIDSEWKESTPLGRVEWVKFFGAITGKEKKADEYFNRIVENVTKIKEEMSKVKVKPKVVWALIYKGNVYMPLNNSYVANMVRDAGCRYITANASPTDISTLLELASKADYMIYSTYYVKSLKDVEKADSRLASLKVFQEHRIYNISHDYWQLGYLHTDRVIQDLAAITHPSLFKNYKPHFFIRLK